MYLSQSSIPKATEPGTVTPSGIRTATRLPGCLVAKASSCWGIWKSRTSSGRSPLSRMPEVPVSPLMSIPCRWMTRLSAPSAFIPCGIAAIARPRWPLLPLPTPEMWPWSAPPQLSPIEPGRPSSRTRSTFPTFPSLTFALAASAVVTPAGSALAPAVTPSGAAWKEGSSNGFFGGRAFFGVRRMSLLTARLPAIRCTARTPAPAPRRRAAICPGGRGCGRSSIRSRASISREHNPRRTRSAKGEPRERSATLAPPAGCLDERVCAAAPVPGRGAGRDGGGRAPPCADQHGAVLQGDTMTGSGQRHRRGGHRLSRPTVAARAPPSHSSGARPAPHR